jgi:hypothetical protein
MPSVARALRIDHTRKAKKLPVRPQSALAGKKEVAKSKSGFDEDDPFSPASSSGSDMSARRRQGGRRRSTCARLRGQRDPRASKDAFFCPLICVVLRKLHASMVLMVSPRPCQDPDVQAVPFHARAQALGATLLYGYVMLIVSQVRTLHSERRGLPVTFVVLHVRERGSVVLSIST